MNDKQSAIQQLQEFLESDDKMLLLTGTHQYEKHRLVLSTLNRLYKNAKILYRINGMQNINDYKFTPLKRIPRSGEFVKAGNNFYCFDSLLATQTWSNTKGCFDFALIYPVDSIFKEGKVDAIDELYIGRKIGKIFLCTWLDLPTYDYGLLDKYHMKHVIYDAESEDPEYHNRVLEIQRRNRNA